MRTRNSQQLLPFYFLLLPYEGLKEEMHKCFNAIMLK